MRQRAAELLREIAAEFQFEIEEMEVANDHVHLFLTVPPRYAIAKVVGLLKSISASELFREFPELKRQLRGGEFWKVANWTCFRGFGGGTPPR
jgi:putative transposase